MKMQLTDFVDGLIDLDFDVRIVGPERGIGGTAFKGDYLSCGGFGVGTALKIDDAKEGTARVFWLSNGWDSADEPDFEGNYAEVLAYLGVQEYAWLKRQVADFLRKRLGFSEFRSLVA